MIYVLQTCLFNRYIWLHIIYTVLKQWVMCYVCYHFKTSSCDLRGCFPRAWSPHQGWSSCFVCCEAGWRWTWTRTSCCLNTCAMRWSGCTVGGMWLSMMCSGDHDTPHWIFFFSFPVSGPFWNLKDVVTFFNKLCWTVHLVIFHSIICLIIYNRKKIIFCCVFAPNHTACCHTARWTLESPSSWRSCWPGNSWSTPLKKRLPNRQYACGSRSAWNAYERWVSQQNTHCEVTFSTHCCITRWPRAPRVLAEAAAVV